MKVVKDDVDGVEKVWVEKPDNGTQWRLVELRPVSEGEYTSYFRGHLRSKLSSRVRRSSASPHSPDYPCTSEHGSEDQLG